MSDEQEHVRVARWRARLAVVRRAIRDAIGLETEGALDDDALAAIVTRAEAAADVAAGAGEHPRTRREVVAVATAAATAVAADVAVAALALLSAERGDALRREMRAAAERWAEETERVRAARAAPPPLTKKTEDEKPN